MIAINFPGIAELNIKVNFGIGPTLFTGAIIFLSAHAVADDNALDRNVVDFSHTVSDFVHETGDAVDVILAGDRYTKKVNDSTMNVGEVVTWKEGGAVSTSPDFGFNLHLPNVERRWQLRFTSYDEEQESRDLTQSTVRTVPRTTEYGAGLFLFHQFGSIKTTFQPRLQLKNPLDMSYFLNFSTSADLHGLKIEPKLQLFADSRKSTGEYFSLAFTMKRPNKWTYSLRNEEEYDQMGNVFTVSHGLVASYAITDRQSLSSAVIVSSQNHPFHLTSWNPSMSFGQEIYHKILSCALSPFLTFEKSNAFKGVAGVSFSLDATF